MGIRPGEYGKSSACRDGCSLIFIILGSGAAGIWATIGAFVLLLLLYWAGISYIGYLIRKQYARASQRQQP
jgi:hypothetical protein